MNDLYLETAKPCRDDEENGRAEIECGGCSAPLDIFDDEVIVVGTADDYGESFCNRCAEKVANSYPGNVHDRREDAEALLRESADTLYVAITQGLLARPETTRRLSTLSTRIARR